MFTCLYSQKFKIQMSDTSKIKINPSCILTVPLHTYGNDFTFIVNGEEFKTSRLISDLISPIISQIHLNDPTISTFTINTSQRGDFSQILNLFNFRDNSISMNEVPFIAEVIEILGNDSIECQDGNKNTEITCDNVFQYIKDHERYGKFYSSRLSSEIDFISAHFYELCETQEEEFQQLTIETLSKIVSNDQIRLNSEDQLLKFINDLYRNDNKYSFLYENVLFENVSSETMKDFTATYDSRDMSRETWLHLSKRLEKDIKDERTDNGQRYTQKSGKQFYASEQNKFNGIINYLREKSNGQIENEINFNASSNSNNSENYKPKVVTQFENDNNYFYTDGEQNAWLCLEFREHRIIPTDYTIRSWNYSQNDCHPRSWVIECSNDNSSWEIVDEEKDCSHLNGSKYVHTFKMNHPTNKEYKYIRMRITGPTWHSSTNYQLIINSFEIFGKII